MVLDVLHHEAGRGVAGRLQDEAAGYDTAPDEAIAAMDRLVDRLEFHRAASWPDGAATEP